MELSEIGEKGLVLLGCGKMGGAMLEGWLAGGLAPGAVWVIDPKPSERLREMGVHVNADLPEDPAVLILAVKPQMMGEALSQVVVSAVETRWLFQLPLVRRSLFLKRFSGQGRRSSGPCRTRRRRWGAGSRR